MCKRGGEANVAELDHWAAKMAAGAPVGAAGDVGECVRTGVRREHMFTGGGKGVGEPEQLGS